MKNPAGFRAATVLLLLCISSHPVFPQGRYPSDTGVTWIGDTPVQFNSNGFYSDGNGLLVASTGHISYFTPEPDGHMRMRDSHFCLNGPGNFAFDHNTVYSYSYGYQMIYSIINNRINAIRMYETPHLTPYAISPFDTTLLCQYGNTTKVISYSDSLNFNVLDSLSVPWFSQYLKFGDYYYISSTHSLYSDSLFTVYHPLGESYSVTSRLSVPNHQVRVLLAKDTTLVAFAWDNSQWEIQFRYRYSIVDPANPTFIDVYRMQEDGYFMNVSDYSIGYGRGDLIADSSKAIIMSTHVLAVIDDPFGEIPSLVDTSQSNAFIGGTNKYAIPRIGDTFYGNKYSGILPYEFSPEGVISYGDTTLIPRYARPILKGSQVVFDADWPGEWLQVYNREGGQWYKQVSIQLNHEVPNQFFSAYEYNMTDFSERKLLITAKQSTNDRVLSLYRLTDLPDNMLHRDHTLGGHIGGVAVYQIDSTEAIIAVRFFTTSDLNFYSVDMEDLSIILLRSRSTLFDEEEHNHSPGMAHNGRYLYVSKVDSLDVFDMVTGDWNRLVSEDYSHLDHLDQSQINTNGNLLYTRNCIMDVSDPFNPVLQPNIYFENQHCQVYALSNNWILTRGIRDGNQYIKYILDITNRESPSLLAEITGMYGTGIFVGDTLWTYGDGSLSGFILTNTQDVAKNNNRIPWHFTLNAIYPNPFNPSTTLSLHLNKSGHTTIAVYNLLGQQVQELLNGPLPMGDYRFTFNGNNLTSGIYFIKVKSGNTEVARKIALLK